MNVEIAQRLAARRRQSGLSQEALAEKLGVSRQAVSKWERSESSPDTDNLIALAHLYGVSLDELLYVDDALKDDVRFEATDRAVGQSQKEEPRVSAEETDGEDVCAPGVDSDEAASVIDDKKKVHIGLDGIHVFDGDDYVHLSWHDGIHVRDGKKGEEVHVGWGGVRVKDASCHDGAKDDDGRRGGGRCRGDGDGFAADDAGTETFYSCADAWHAAYGRCRFDRSWTRFPYPLLALLMYLLLGFFADAWGSGLFLFFTVPVYYMIGHAITHRRVAPLVAGLYPLGVTAWFCYMAFGLNSWHPAWALFLTIPLVEWLVHALSRWWSRSHAKAASESTRTAG